jgi:uncharacterized iron-regulated membrane protein
LTVSSINEYVSRALEVVPKAAITIGVFMVILFLTGSHLSLKKMENNDIKKDRCF